MQDHPYYKPTSEDEIDLTPTGDLATEQTLIDQATTVHDIDDENVFLEPLRNDNYVEGTELSREVGGEKPFPETKYELLEKSIDKINQQQLALAIIVNEVQDTNELRHKEMAIGMKYIKEVKQTIDKLEIETSKQTRINDINDIDVDEITKRVSKNVSKENHQNIIQQNQGEIKKLKRYLLVAFFIVLVVFLYLFNKSGNADNYNTPAKEYKTEIDIKANTPIYCNDRKEPHASNKGTITGYLRTDRIIFTHIENNVKLRCFVLKKDLF